VRAAERRWGREGSIGRLRVGAGVGSGVGGIEEGTKETAVCVRAAWSVATMWVVSASTVLAASVRTLSSGSVGVTALDAG